MASVAKPKSVVVVETNADAPLVRPFVIRLIDLRRRTHRTFSASAPNARNAARKFLLGCSCDDVIIDVVATTQSEYRRAG
jgi:hypothetical protein